MVLGALLSEDARMAPSDEPSAVRPPASGDPVPYADPEPVVKPVVRRRSTRPDPGSSLRPELLSGRSLQAPRRESRWGVVRENKGIAVAVALLVCAVVVVAAGKFLAEGAADRAVEKRVEEVESLLGDAEPQDLMAFGASVGTDGSMAQRVRDTDGFVNVKAGADLAFVRFQPSGWWSGFTERCIVVLVRTDGVTIETPSVSCNRVQAPAG